jgi:hypothetical protein
VFKVRQYPNLASHLGNVPHPWTLKQEAMFSMNFKKCASQVLRREDSYIKSLRMGRILDLKVTKSKN